MNWIDELIAKLGQQQAPAGPDTTGYTSSVMYDRGGPYYTPSADPAQFQPPYQAPYGEGQMIGAGDISGSPMGRTSQTGMSQLAGDLAGRANSAYPQSNVSAGNVRDFNLHNMAYMDAPASAPDLNDARLRAFMRLIAEHAAIQQQKANRGGSR